MIVLQGLSHQGDAHDAISEATSHWAHDASPDMLFVFHSSQQRPNVVSSLLAARFPDTLIAGASTAGEWFNNRHQQGSLVLLAISSPHIHWAIAVAEPLNRFSEQAGTALCRDLFQQLDIHFTELNPEHHFCLSFIDGMSKCEEGIISMVASELGNIPLLGGSAGDDLKFEHSFVLANGKAFENAAVFVLAESQLPFTTFKHQHFIPGKIDTIITQANTAERIVYHLDGMPAAERFAQIIGLEVKDLNAKVFSEHPLIYQSQHECYVRSISQLGQDNSLIFYCAIEEGMLLNLCSRQDMVSQAKRTLSDIREPLGKATVMLIFNCILRRLEAESIHGIQEIATEMAATSQHVIGFDTYGEQWQGLHINQTMVGLVIHE